MNYNNHNLDYVSIKYLCSRLQHFQFYYAIKVQKICVQFYWPGYRQLPIHRRDPTTAQHGNFCLLRLRPGPIRSSFDNLDTPSSPGETILMPSLARTPDRHRATCDRAPDLKPSNKPSLQVSGLQEHATTPSCSKGTSDLMSFYSGVDAHKYPYFTRYMARYEWSRQ